MVMGSIVLVFLNLKNWKDSFAPACGGAMVGGSSRPRALATVPVPIMYTNYCTAA